MMPYHKLPAPRPVPHHLPSDLAEFYATHEGCGFDHCLDNAVRIARLDELKYVVGCDLGPGLTSPWRSFAALRIGASLYGDEILYILQAPICPAGSIAAFGCDIAGPGGDGVEVMEGSLVLAAGFAQWIQRLERYRGEEYALAPGGIDKLPTVEQSELRAFYRSLNPQIEWG